MEDGEAAWLVHWNLDQRPQLGNCTVFLEEDTLLTQCSLSTQFQFTIHWSLHPGVERPVNCNGMRAILQIAYFTVVCLVARPLNRSEAKGDLVMIQTLLLSKVLCFHAKQKLVSITTRSSSASLQIKGLATKSTAVKWPIESCFRIEEKLLNDELSCSDTENFTF